MIDDAESQGVVVNADPTLLKRALDNLLRNAMRYAKKQIVLELVDTPDHCCIQIHDDGCGIEEKDCTSLVRCIL